MAKKPTTEPEQRTDERRREPDPVEGSHYAASSAESGGNYPSDGATASDITGDPIEQSEDERIGGESPPETSGS